MSMMMDGRFDQHFAELFAASLSEDPRAADQDTLWPLVAVTIWLVAFAGFALVG